MITRSAMSASSAVAVSVRSSTAAIVALKGLTKRTVKLFSHHSPFCQVATISTLYSLYYSFCVSGVVSEITWSDHSVPVISAPSFSSLLCLNRKERPVWLPASTSYPLR